MMSKEPHDMDAATVTPKKHGRVGCTRRPPSGWWLRALLGILMAWGCLFWSLSVVAQDESHAERRGLFVVGEDGRVAPDDDVSIAIVIGGDLQIEGRVRGVAAAIGGSLDVEPGALVEGAGVAVGGEVNVSDGARVLGAQMRVGGGDMSAVMGELVEARATPPPLWLGPLMRLAQVIGLFIVATLFIWLFPEQVRTVRTTTVQQPMYATLAGLGLLIGFVPLVLVLGLTLFGIPLVWVVFAVIAVAVTLGLAGLSASVGRGLRVVRNEHNLYGAAVAGFLLLALLSALPVVGGIALLLAGLYGAGAALLSRFGTRLLESPSQRSERPPPGQTEVAARP